MASRVAWARDPQPVAYANVDTFGPSMPLKSSNLASARYSATEGILEIQFLSGSVYWYRNVTPATFDGLLTALSPGRYLREVLELSHPFERK